MKRNDLEIVSVKEWGSPRSNVQLFMPQEYCENCFTKSVATLSGWSNANYRVYIDLNGDGYYQMGESFQLTGTSFASPPDQITNGNVGIYYLKEKDGADINKGFAVGAEYDDFDFKQGSKTYHMVLKTIASTQVKIISKAAFVKDHTAS